MLKSVLLDELGSQFKEIKQSTTQAVRRGRQLWLWKENRQVGIPGSLTHDTVIRQKSGQVAAGGAIGALCHEKIWFPSLPGWT